MVNCRKVTGRRSWRTGMTVTTWDDTELLVNSCCRCKAQLGASGSQLTVQMVAAEHMGSVWHSSRHVLHGVRSATLVPLVDTFHPPGGLINQLRCLIKED